MKLLLVPLLAFAVPHCNSVPLAPPPATVPSAPVLGAAAADRLSKISAAAESADEAANHIVDPVVRAAVKGPLSVVRELAGPGTEKDRAYFRTLVAQAFAGKLDSAQAGWATARADAAALTVRVGELEAKVASEQQSAAVELQRQLTEARDQARRDAEARERAIKTWLFFGVGTLLLLAAVATIFLKAYLPQLGPNITLCLGLAGAVLIITGILVRAIERLIEDHPVIFWSGLLAALLALVAAAALAWANHHHAKEAVPA